MSYFSHKQLLQAVSRSSGNVFALEYAAALCCSYSARWQIGWQMDFANPPAHPALLLLERLPKHKVKVVRICDDTTANPHDTNAKAKAEALQKQRAAEQAAFYEAKLKAQGALKLGREHLLR